MRNTLQRQIILNAVAELNIHATAEQVFEYVHKTHPSISKATVYRNLKQLADGGELLSVGALSGSNHYDHNCHEHYHFICGNCECVYDVDGSLADIVMKNVQPSDEFEITECLISFSGICKKCSY
ncbi:MAG: transcriptional repressor [Defluviitaleaceae bacterium]|nr:transcriptional repressor [Defluviitaleaceae bacterium]